MILGKRVLVVVPARGGSKGIRLKNLSLFNGEPLVAVAGRAASEICGVDRKIVSTDHNRIAEVAKQAGLGVPFMRGKELSGDTVGDYEVLSDALVKVELADGVQYDLVVMLQPTSPLRDKNEVQKCIRTCIEGNYDAVWTVSETDSKYHPLKQLTVTGVNNLEFYDSRGAEIIARQQLSKTYHRNGVAYAITRECLLVQKSIKGNNTGYVITEGEHVSIDTVEDLDRANTLYEYIRHDH